MAKKAAIKRVAKKKTAKKFSCVVIKSKSSMPKTPPGYCSQGSVLVPEDFSSKLVSASKIKAGLKKAQDEIKGMIQDIIDSMIGNYSIKEIELMASFSADGRFLGIGVGGATSIKITIAPEDK